MAKLKTGRHTSAQKAQRQAERRTSRNKGLTKKINITVKAALAGAKTKDEKSAEKMRLAQSSIDKAAKKGVIHKRAAARKKSRLAKAANKAAAAK